MKRTITALLLLALLIGCTNIPTEAKASTAALSSSTATETDEATNPNAAILTEDILPFPTQNETPAPTETPEPTDAPKAQPLYVGVTNKTLSDPLELPITIKEIDWEKLSAGKQYGTKFYNETVSFQNLRVTVADFASDESGTQFTLRLDLPEEWTDLQCLSMNPCFGFRFYLDGKPQHDFRLIDQSAIFGVEIAENRCDSFTMTYRSETVTDDVMHAYHEWTVVPFFWYWKVFIGDKWNNKNGRTWIDVTNGDYCEYNGGEIAYSGGEIEITELTDLSLTLPIEHTHEPVETPKEPKLLQVSIWREDVERNQKEGHYGKDGRLKDGSYVVYGTWQNVTVDFSELEFYVERFYYWEHGFFYLFHIVYPESWSEEVRRNVRIDIRTYADGEPFGEAIDGKGHIRWYISYGGASNWRNVGNPNNNAPYPTEIYRFCDSHRFSLTNPIEQKELTSKITLEYFPTIRFDNSDKEIDITNGEPYYMESIHAYEHEVDIPLTEFSISTDTFPFRQGGAQ
ncbi:MAG: hypothetical protein IKZ44_09350 [Clostridia bacterium]|nr:hypothetical protein [Clostridia bacterium]